MTDSMATSAVKPAATRPRHRNPKRPVWQEQPSTATQGAKAGTIVVILLLIAFPLYSITLTSFSNQASINIAGGLVVWPHGLTLNAYKLIAQGGVVGRALLISLVLTAVGTTLSMLVTILASYGLSRAGSPGHKTILWFMMITMFFNGGIIPLFLVVSALGGYDQYWALILPSAVSVFNIIVMRAFFMNIASDMIDSARIDGASDWTILRRIVLPTSKAVTAVIALFYAVGYWNSWFNILLFMPADSAKWPLQMVLYSYVTQGLAMPGSGAANLGQYAGNQAIAPLSLQMAVVTLTVIPVLIVYPFVQKHFTKGVLIGAIKGLCTHRGSRRAARAGLMATLADVAKHAGVSASTVSNVLTGKGPVSDKTRRRVERSIALLKYRPHAGARALASSRSNVLAMFIPLRPDIYVPVMLDIALSVSAAAREYGYDVLLITSGEGTDGIERIVATARADGVILTDVATDDERIDVLAAARVPAVLMGVPSDLRGMHCIDLDCVESGRLCVRELVRLGHREIAFIGEPDAVYRRHASFAERTLAGAREEAAASGVGLIHRPCEATFEAAAGVLARVLEERPDTTGLIVQNEAVLSPLLSLLRTARRAVPEDVSIVTVCQDQIAEQTSPRLTSVTLPACDLGAGAVELLINAINHADGTGGVMLIPPVLTVRGSTTTAPAC